MEAESLVEESLDCPWKLNPHSTVEVQSIVANPWNLEPHRKNNFSHCSRNLSFDLKRAAVKASASVVGILSRLGATEIFRGSGFVIESIAVDGKFVSTILTSASIFRPEAHIDALADGVEMSVILCNEITYKGDILAYDFHYNIGVLKIETDVPIAIGRLRHVNDSISIDPNLQNEKPFKFDPQSDKFILVPGDTVVALGRYHVEQNGLMVVAGEFSADHTGLDCQELFTAELEISRFSTFGSSHALIRSHGIGGPLINCYGEVIGINFYCASFTPFLPINIVSMWWEQSKKNGHCLLPRLGMVLGNLYTGEPAYLEYVIKRFPNIFKGVAVDKITLESPAYSTAMLPLDVIVECDGKSVGSMLEFFELMWDKVGQPVHLGVLRPSDGSRLNVTMTVGNVGPNQFNRWPLPKQRKRRLMEEQI